VVLTHGNHHGEEDFNPGNRGRNTPVKQRKKRFNGVNNPSGCAFGYDPTGRCHKREFLLKFPRDRRRWIEWLYQAKKRYSGLSVLNYMVTSNHVHLLAFDNDAL